MCIRDIIAKLAATNGDLIDFLDAVDDGAEKIDESYVRELRELQIQISNMFETLEHKYG